MWYDYVFWISIGLILLILLTSFICFLMTFYVGKRKVLKEGEYDLPPGKEYEPYYDNMKNWIDKMRNFPYEKVEIKSHDGLTLKAKYFENIKGAPIEIMIHGYKGNAERDMNGGIFRAFAVGRNALLIDQRGSGDSEGHVLTFGIKERKDVRLWIDFLIDKFGKDVRIILTGISMGASTALMTTQENIPSNVIGVLADCGFSSQKEIISKTIKEMKLPPKLFYPFVKLGGLIFGRFNIDELTPIDACKNMPGPVIFFHGDNDYFVPCYMSEEMSKVCSNKNKFVIIPNAEHGLAYPSSQDYYISKVKEFQKECNE